MERWRRVRKVMMVGIGYGILLVGLTGCSEKITRENYNKLRVGMDYKEVTKVLGEPQECRAVLQARSCTWGKEPRVINIQFISEKAGVFSSRGL